MTTLSLSGSTFGGLRVGAQIGTYFGGPVGTLVGGVIGGLAGSLRGPRQPTISQARITGNAFAQACIRRGVGSDACPIPELERWTELSRTRYPNAYRDVFAPLLARRPVQLDYVQGLARRYLAKRTKAPGYQQARQKLLGTPQQTLPSYAQFGRGMTGSIQVRL